MIEFVLLLALAVAFYVALTMGANSEIMATTVGTGIFSLRRAAGVAAIFIFFGALILGGGVAKTIGEGIIPKEALIKFSLAPVIIGVVVGTWALISSWRRVPISSTHSVLGAILGFSLVQLQEINWVMVSKIILSAILSPIFAMLLAVLFYSLLMGYLRKSDGIWHRERKEIFLGFLQMATAGFVAFAFGANEVGKAIGILLPYFESSSGGILLLGATGMSLGALMWSHRILKTVGKDVTELIPSRGLVIELSSALSILSFTWIAMPISISHTRVGATIGVGLARGIKKVKGEVVKSILLSWFVTIPFTMLLAATLAKILI